VPEITNIRLDQRRNSLRVRFLEGDRVIENFDGQPGGSLPSKIGSIRIATLGSAGGEARGFLDQAEGIGISARDDTTSFQRKRVDSGESLRFRILDNRNYNSAVSATIQLDRFSAGAQVTVSAYYKENFVGQQTVGAANFTFAPGGVFDLLVLTATDGSQFTFRSVDFAAVKSTDLRYQRGEGLALEAVQDDNVIQRVIGDQNGRAPSVGPFTIYAGDSAEQTTRPGYENFVDRTFLDQGEGIGITDGDDAATNSNMRKRIEGDEVLGFAITGYEAALAVFDVGNVQSADGANIRLTAYSNGAFVKDQIFSLGSATTASLSLAAGSAFDLLHLSPGDADTSFTFLGADFGAFPK
jgi:hypothetical protein